MAFTFRGAKKSTIIYYSILETGGNLAFLKKRLFKDFFNS